MKRVLTATLVLACLAGSAGSGGATAAAGRPAAAKQPAAQAIPRSVRIAGVRVAGLDTAAATAAVRTAFARPLPVVVDGVRMELHPANLATAYLKSAVSHARAATPGTNVHLTVAVHGAAVRAAVAHIATRFDRRGTSASLKLTDGVPHVTPEVPGHQLDQEALAARIVHALNANVRLPVSSRTRTVAPAATESSLGPVILINRSKNRLYLFKGNALWRAFPVATGQAIYPTPTGRFHIVVKQLDPWWYPPTYDAWAKGLKPVPPGPGNPLGTRWMGLSVPGVGIHGTDEPGSIGYSASHGCIRMQVVDSEWLFGHVDVGTTVFIV